MDITETEFLNAYDLLIEIISESEFHSLKHKFFRSYKLDYEYTHNNICSLIKCDHDTLLFEIVFYDLKTKSIKNNFSYRFTQCEAYYELLEYFTSLRFKESAFCKESYGKANVNNDLLREVETFMKHREDQLDESSYKWS